MKCPYCEKTAQVRDVVLLNAESYSRSVKARTDCCGALIRIYPVIKFVAHPTEQDGTDDWGR